MIIERLESYINWIESKGKDGFDKDECLSYLHEALAAEKHCEELEMRLENSVELPCKVGDTIFVIDSADCKIGECPDVDTEDCKYSAYHAPTEETYVCRGKHRLVREIYVDEINVNTYFDYPDFGDDGEPTTEIIITINDWYEVESEKNIYFTYEEAEKALKEQQS